MTKRRRHTPDQIIRKIAEGHKLLAGGRAALLASTGPPSISDHRSRSGLLLLRVTAFVARRLRFV